ncbi:hypothetical protein M9H77_24434 [Catharanthus roseus]|uniref:Uncharacterized protein n=1 Tax=Catharanthus roseus TaxID=4058 RepID=A0ACC0AWG8_CATRO|nr:hypothetical protein M9H77_24434 [Catharanthus roseus]
MSNFPRILLQLKFDMFLHPMLISLFLAILLWIFLKCFSAKKKNLSPPSPRGLPILGNLHQLSPLLHRSLGSLSQKYGSIMLLQFGSLPTVIISSAEAAAQVLKTHEQAFLDRPYLDISARLIYNNKGVAVAPYGEHWRKMKSIFVHHLLSNKRVCELRGIREQEIALMMENIEGFSSSSSLANLSEMITSTTNDIVCRSAFGTKFGEGENGEKFRFLFTEFLQVLGTTNLGLFFPWLKWTDRVTGVDSRVEKLAKGLDQFLDNMIQERLEKGLIGSSKDFDFLDILLSLHKDNSEGVSIDRDSVKALILDVFSAGTSTSAAVTEWAMAELIKHPNVMKKLQNEVRGILCGRQEITDNDLEKMCYLKAVIKETFRLHLPNPILVPSAAREDTEVMGYHVTAGSVVIINAWVIGRDPALWDKPEEFLPDRFLNSSIDYKGQDFQLIPFGSGRRGCPGAFFAMASNELMLANLLNKFDWELPNGAKGEDLDMTEDFGLSIRRKLPLLGLKKDIYCEDRKNFIKTVCDNLRK